MSRTMQLTVEAKPHYPHSFAASYPHLARNLETIVPGFIGPGPSLLELAGRIDELLARAEGTELARLLDSHAATLRRCRTGVEELTAEWELAQADRLLYELEDTFDAVEAELARG